MNVYQMSIVAAAGLVIAVGGLAKGMDDSLYVSMIGFLVCISFLIQTVRMLQRQIDELKSTGSQTTEEETK